MCPEPRRYESIGKFTWVLLINEVPWKGVELCSPMFLKNYSKMGSAIAEVGWVDFDFKLTFAWDCSVKPRHGSNVHLIWLDFMQGIKCLLLIFIINITATPKAKQFYYI